MNKINHFLDQVCLHISCRAVHNDIRQELAGHISERKDAYMSEGLSEDEALEKAICAMGDADDIGMQLDKQHRTQMEWSILTLTLLIAILGAAAMFFISRASGQIHFSGFLFSSAIGTAVLFAVTMFDFTKLYNLCRPIYIAINLILFLGLFGLKVNGVPRVHFAGFGFMPPELLHVAIVPLSVWLSRAERWGDYVRLLFLAALPMALTALYPSTINIFIFAVMLLISVVVAIIKNDALKNKKQTIIICCLFLILAAGIGFFLMPNYLRAKLLAFVDFNADPLGAGYLPMTVQKWLAASKPLGAADYEIYGAAIDGALPNAASEYVLVNIITKFGWIAGIGFVSVVLVFLVRLFITANKVKNRFGFFLSFSACLILALKFTLSILMNFNLFPYAGLSVPLLSYGGTDYVLTMALIGLVLSVWRRNNILPAEKEKDLLRKEKKNALSFEDGKLTIDFKKAVEFKKR